MDPYESIRRFFREQAAAAPEPPMPAALVAEMPAVDLTEETDLTVLRPGGQLLTEGQYFIIEYKDASGRSSVRRISVYAVKASGTGIPALMAKCHERNAARCFRLDRISSVFDHDGIAIEPLSAFYRDAFGLRWPVPGLVFEDPDIPANRKTLVRDVCRRRGVVLLAALALADRELCDDEIGVILDACAEWCEVEKIELSQDEVASLSGYVRRLRPTPEAVEKATERLITEQPENIRSMLSWGVRVIEADGFLHHREVSLLNEISRELTGISAV